MDEIQTFRTPDRRRKTVFRKVRQLCRMFRLRAIVVLVDESDRQWIYKTDDHIPFLDQVGLTQNGLASRILLNEEKKKRRSSTPLQTQMTILRGFTLCVSGLQQHVLRRPP
jgi:hypothetical protein